MKKTAVFALSLILFSLLSSKVSAFCIIEAVFDLNPFGGAKYVYNGIDVPSAQMFMDMGVELHFLYPMGKKGTADHFGVGLGVFSAAQEASGKTKSTEETNLSLNTHWLKIQAVLAYSYIINSWYLNIDAGAYYAIGGGGRFSLDSYQSNFYYRIKYMKPEHFNPDYGLHFRIGIGFGIPDKEMYYETGSYYPTIMGFSAGISLNISMAELLSSPSEDWNNFWNLGFYLGVPFFLQI
jgi:hypothetical protein